MRKLKPSVKAAIASTLVLTSAAAIAYAVPKITNEENTKSTGNELKLEVERVDSDTVKVAIDNIQDIPKALQFSIKLDGVKLQDGQGSIRDLVKSEIETRLKNKEYSTSTNDVLTDYTYNEKDNTIDVLITAENSLPKVGNKVEIFELDVKAASKDIQTYKILPNDTSDYKYVSNTNKEYSNLGVTSDNESIYLETLPTITSDDSYIKIVEGGTLELTYENLQEKIGLQMSHEDGNNDLILEVTKDGKVIDKFTENTVGIYKLELRAVKNKTVKSEPLQLTVNVALDDVTEPPTITRNDEELKDITLDGGSTFKPLENVKAVDKNGRSVEVSVKVDKELNLDPDKDTTYTLTYTATDVYGNTATKKITLTVNANKPPVILGAKDLVLKVGDTFDPAEGVTVEDEDEDDDIELKIESNVDTRIAGEYKVLYSATDSKGKTTKVQIKVTVNPKQSAINNVPVITANDVTIKVGDEFDPKAGVTANDKEDGKINSENIKVIENTVDTTKAGTYTVKYSVTDSQGATATKTIKVTVLPKQSAINNAPVITANDRVIKVGTTFNPMDGVTATDKEDGNLTKKIKVTGEVDTSKAGTYKLVYSVEDSQGAKSSVSVTITVEKNIVESPSINEVPVISGAKDITIKVGDIFDVMSGVTATDKEDGDITKKIKVTGEVDTSKAGTYKLVYSVEDSKGAKTSTTVTITVLEDESQKPGKPEVKPEIPESVSDLIDSNIMEVLSGDGKSETPLVTSLNKITLNELNEFLEKLKNSKPIIEKVYTDGDETVFKIKLNANKQTPKLFRALFRSSEDVYMELRVKNEYNDLIERLNEFKEEITIKDINTLPVINASNITIKVGDTFDPMSGVTASDKEDGDLTKNIKVTGTVDTSKAGEYKLTYSVTDKDNATVSIVRIIAVVEENTNPIINNIPVINLSDLVIKIGTDFDPMTGVTATDIEDGNLTKDVKVTGTVDTSKAGEYKLTYSVTDSQGATVSVERTITVVGDLNEYENPKTGDASILGYIGLASVAAGGIFINRKRKK